ncbi:uncharacterized protein LOC114283200 [Camellia sinensis]|uniref:uncharacterized protein LOC114283200 n=1 Tax=Camellia sinensis TaxID=4442 RepID=UPI001035A89A|nr:uncharacterized protein LOC114283200 [Camellia sinensis]
MRVCRDCKRTDDDSDLKDRHDPFIQRITKVVLPKMFKAPSFTLYDGKSDPTDHVHHYKKAMTLHADDEALMCRILPSSLGPLIVRWYYKLEPASIKSFYQLQKSFRARFITNETQPKQADSLWTMKIKYRETLSDYSACYWECFNLVDDDCNNSMAIMAYKMGLHLDSQLRSLLTQSPSKTVYLLMKKVEKYCKVEDDAIWLKVGLQVDESITPVMAQPLIVVPPERTLPKRSPDTKCQSRRDHRQESRQRNELYQLASRCPQQLEKQYAEFIEPIGKILSKIQHQPFFRWPSKLFRPPNKRQRDQRCEYHKDYGHIINKCYALKDHLEKLVQGGRLVEFLPKTENPPGFDPMVAMYSLNVNPKAKPIIPIIRHSGAEHTTAVIDEADKLLEAGAIWEVAYPTWLSNTVVAKKKTGS